MSSHPDESHTVGGENQEWKLLRDILQQVRIKTLQQILAHPDQQLSREELEYRNPSTDRSSLQYHLRELTNKGVLQKNEIPAGSEKRSRDLPSTFYQVTPLGERLLKQANLYEEIEDWKVVYERMERTDRIRRIEDPANRPE